MSVSLLVLFSTAMISAIAAKTVVGLGGAASVVSVCLLLIFVVLMRVQGIRKPVI